MRACVMTVAICISIVLSSDSRLWVMASADVLPRLQQRALQADQIISRLKAQLQQLKCSSSASSMLFLRCVTPIRIISINTIIITFYALSYHY